MRYPGGKGRAYPRIINMMPPHRVYIETHLGGGAVLRHKRPAERSIGIEIDPSIVQAWRDRPAPVPNLQVCQSDALVFLRDFPFAGDELIYADPPYVRTTRRRRGRCYRFEYNDENHLALLCELRRLPCAVMVSGYPSTLYSDLLADWNAHPLSVATHMGITTETLWCNFDLPSRLHDHRFVGEDFRERERVRRRVDRWIGRLERMEPIERHAVISAVNERFAHGEDIWSDERHTTTMLTAGVSP
jgi:DNA adenine methylase